MLPFDWESIAKDAADVATGAITNINPIAGILFGWSTRVAFEIIDDEIKKADPVAAAQHVGDSVAKLLEDLKFGSS